MKFCFRFLLFAGLLSVALPCFAFDFSAHGYYRTRIVASHDLDLQRPNNNIPYSDDRFGFVSYNQMRLRLLPALKLNDNISIHAQFDILDNLLYGTSNTKELNILSPTIGTLTMPAGAGSFSMVGGTAGENGSVNVRSVYMDILTPIGKFRLGRQPTHWGLGIFQNDGLSRQADFGDMNDGILYMLQVDSSNYGTFSGGILWGIAYEAQYDPRTQGFGGQVRDMVANSRDTQNYAGVLKWDNGDDMSIGVFGGVRRRNGQDGATTMMVKLVDGTTVAAGDDGDTLLYFADLYAKYVYKNYKFQLEGAYVGGKITTGIALDQIAFAGVTPNTQVFNLPEKQPMRVFMAAFEAEAKYNFGGEWKFWAGYAPGDADPLSSRITQLGFRPDYQIALMMFNQPLGTSASYRDATTGNKLGGGQWVTGNYINNALYFAAGYKHLIDIGSYVPDCDSFKVGAKVVTAWAPKKNVNVNFSDLIPGIANLPDLTETSESIWQRWYGLEFDVSAEAQFFEHLYTALEGGFLYPGRAYNIDVRQISLGSLVKPIPYDRAKIGWMLKGTVMAEF